ncbi:MAG: hypothetical protein IT328_19380 [Caldilineaceae bacterium]|nr:hypothetical protein [Caldilineaceae bacterium]
MSTASTHRTPDEGQAWSRRWRTWLRTLGLAGGERSGSRVKRLDVLHGRIVAQVQDRSGQLCDVEIRFVPWSDEEWQRVVDALSSQALFAAQLLAGDLPPDLDRTVAATGVELLPATIEELEHECSCHIDGRKSCDHIAAVYAALGELLPEDPWLLFRLRGRDQQGLLRSLRAQRSRAESSPSAAAADKTENRRSSATGFYRASGAVEEEIQPLSEQVAGFWGSARAQNDFRPHILSPAVELTLLRRLGPPPLGNAALSTYEALTTLYRRISRAALDLAYDTDSPENSPENGDHSANGAH